MPVGSVAAPPTRIVRQSASLVTRNVLNPIARCEWRKGGIWRPAAVAVAESGAVARVPEHSAEGTLAAHHVDDVLGISRNAANVRTGRERRRRKGRGVGMSAAYLEI